MSKSRIPSPARSQTALVTPRRSKPRGPRSVGSPARSNSSVRLSSVIQNFKDKDMDSFRLSPLNSRRSVLNDNTDIEVPGRRSWWKKLNDTSMDILKALENDQPEGAYNVLEEYMDVEALSQEKKNDLETLNRPDSSDSDSISSIVIPQRKLFTQKENQPKKKFAQVIGTRESMAKHNKTEKYDKTIVAGTKKLFGESSKPKSKPAFPSELLTFSPDTTVNITPEEVKGRVRNLFGNRAVVKRKNKFADFIASESEDEPEIQPKVFSFRNKHDAPSRRVSTASSLTTDIDMEDWKLLPSSTMVQTQLEAMMADSPVKKAKLSKLSEGKESETATNSTATTNKTKQLNKSVLSKNKSTSSKNSSNKSKISPEVNISVRKSVSYEAENRNDKENEQCDADEGQDTSTNIVQKSVNATLNKSKESNKSVASKNKSKINSSKNPSNKTIQPYEEPENYQNLELNVDEVPTDLKNAEKNSDKSKQSNSIMSKNASQMSPAKNKSKTSPKVNKSVRQWILEDAVSENESQVIELQFDAESREAIADAHIPEDLNIVDNVKEKDADQINISSRSNNEQYNKSVTTINKSKKSYVKHSFNKSKTSPKANNNDESKMDIAEDNRQNDKDRSKVPDEDQNIGNDNFDIKNSNKFTSILKETSNKSKTAPNVNANEKKSTLNEAEPEIDDQVMGVEEDEENRIALTYSDEEPMEQEKENLSKNVADDNRDESDAVDNSQQVRDKNVKNVEKIINESLDINDSKEEKENDEEESHEIQNENNVSDDEDQESEVEEVEDEEENQEMGEANTSHEIEIDDPAETEEDSEVINKENASQEVEAEDEDNEEENIAENEIEEDENEEENIAENEDEIESEEENEEVELEEENESQQDQSQEIEENHEVEDEEGEAEDEENESQEIINNSVGDAGNEILDHTGRNRKENETNAKSPEAVLKYDVNLAESFIAKGRHTSIRETRMPKSLNIRPSLAPSRESTGLPDGTRNSSAEGSGWDSHRTTRKTLRQTFGRDFTPRKSLRALVMENTAKRHEVFNDINDVDMPRANSTELPDASNRDDETMEGPHEISKRTQQTTLERYLQEVKNKKLEEKKKLQEEVKRSLAPPPKELFNQFKVPSRPFVLKRATKPAQSKPKTKTINSMVPLGYLPQEVIEDMKYKPPKRFQPRDASWITKHLYKFLETKLEPKYDYKARIRAEKLVEMLYNFVKSLRRVEVAPTDSVNVLKQEMAHLSIVSTHFDFYEFIHEFMPREVRIKVVPDILNKIPAPRHGVFSEILRGNRDD